MRFNEGLPSDAPLRSGMLSNEGLDQTDPNMLLIGDYLAGALGDEERQVVEQRLQSDPAFFNDVMPIIELVEALRETPPHPTKRVGEGTTARITVHDVLSLRVAAGATAVVTTAVGEVTLPEGNYLIESSPTGHRIHREDTSV
jgi:hypothetical protein